MENMKKYFLILTMLAFGQLALAGDALDSVIKCHDVQNRLGQASYTVFISSQGKTRDAVVIIIDTASGKSMNLPNETIRTTNSWMDLNEEKILMMKNENQSLRPVLWIKVKQENLAAASDLAGTTLKAERVIYKGEIEFKNLGSDLGSSEAKDKNVSCECGTFATENGVITEPRIWKEMLSGCTPNGSKRN